MVDYRASADADSAGQADAHHSGNAALMPDVPACRKLLSSQDLRRVGLWQHRALSPADGCGRNPAQLGGKRPPRCDRITGRRERNRTGSQPWCFVAPGWSADPNPERKRWVF